MHQGLRKGISARLFFSFDDFYLKHYLPVKIASGQKKSTP